MPADAAIDDLLEGLNPPQRDAVTHGEGPLLILAGAGSGKTRVLTHRIAYLLRTGQAKPSEILAITFTNKAAAEMRERVELLVGRATRAMWVMTFHAACARMLRSHADQLGYTRQFTIYDSADQRRLIKKCLDDQDIDLKRFTPRAMQSQISDAKNKLRSAEDLRQLVGSYFEQTVADVYEQYERELNRANAMDFDDLLVHSVHLLERFQEVRDRYAEAFRWVMVDEYQDTNHVQYRWLQLLTSEHRNLAVVGDDAQCLVAGTPITMGDGSIKPIEAVAGGRRGAVVLRQRRFPARARHRDVRVAAPDGCRDRHARRSADRQHAGAHALRGLPRRLHAAAAPDVPDVAARQGLPRRHDADAPVRPAPAGPRAADPLHRRSTRTPRGCSRSHDTEPEARAAEQLYALKYGIPTLPFVARRARALNGLVHDQALIDRVFDEHRLLRARHAAAARLAPRLQVPAPRSAVVRGAPAQRDADALRRPARPHGRCTSSRSAGATRRRASGSIAAGLSVRPAKRGSQSWRYESCFSDFGRAVATVDRIRSAIPATVRPVARLGSKSLAVHARRVGAARAW